MVFFTTSSSLLSQPVNPADFGPYYAMEMQEVAAEGLTTVSTRLDPDSVEYTTDEWYQLLASADRMESLINGHWEVLGEFDAARRVKLIVDEWGAWHARAADMPPTYLWAYPGSLRDALVAALTLDTFNRHADKIVMANVAQLVNTIHSLFLAHENRDRPDYLDDILGPPIVPG